MIAARCHYCSIPVDPSDSQVARRVVGWERRPIAASRKSGSDIMLREHLDEYACSACITRLRMGLNVQQGALL